MSVVAARLILDVVQGTVCSARILDHRSWQVSTLLAHKTVAEAEQLAGLLLRLCAEAQKIALRVACAAAQGLPCEPASEQLALPLRCAMVRDHAWYLLLTLPQACGLPVATPSLKTLQEQSAPQALQHTLQVLLQDDLLGMPAHQWLELPAAAFQDWYAAQQTRGAHLLRAMTVDPVAPGACSALLEESAPLPDLAHLDEGQLLAWVRAGAQGPSPTHCLRWQGRVVQTGALVRHWEHPLVCHWRASRGGECGARVLARLVELAQLGTHLMTPGRSMVRAWNLDPGHGLAAVETARGLLLHEVDCAQGWIRQYKIISPTDWNLTAGGALSEALRAAPARRECVLRILQSFDPCLELALEFVHA